MNEKIKRTASKHDKLKGTTCFPVESGATPYEGVEHGDEKLTANRLPEPCATHLPAGGVQPTSCHDCDLYHKDVIGT